LKLLRINIIQSCNQNCWYCPMASWLYPAGFYFPPNPGEDEETALKNRKYANCITNGALLKWLDKYIDPEEWRIELTGGEPGLYKEIGTLIPALNEKGYKGVIKTNGSLPIPRSRNFIITAAWHEGIKDIPPYHDKILIIRNPRDNWKAKEAYCKERNIPYRLLDFNYDYMRQGEKKMPVSAHDTVFDGICAIFSMGQIAACPSAVPDDENSIFEMSPPVVRKIEGGCKKCVECLSAESDLQDNAHKNTVL